MNTGITSEQGRYEICRSELSKLLSKAQAKLTDSAILERIQHAQHRVSNDKLKILIVGEFSRGKSTFINTLLGLPLLPSKVNPTTATINIIKKAQPPSINIHFHEGESISHALPQEGVGRFLDTIVTTSNNESSKIREVEILWPAGVYGWDVLLVDTPGVNDLDDLRQEVTYDYLSQADACIILLDSQQPLTASELRFINDKVMGQDISRLFFVLNRMDEIPRPNSDPDEVISNRLMEYVKKRLNESVPGLKDPMVHAVASKPVLRERYKETPTTWAEVFTTMEQSLFQFVNDNATENRIPDHFERVKNILGDVSISLNEKLNLLSKDKRGVKQELERIDFQRKGLDLKLNQIGLMFQKRKRHLKKSIQEFLETSTSDIRKQFISDLQAIETDQDLIAIKSSINRKVKHLIEDVRDEVYQHRKKMQEELSDHFKEVLNKPIKLGSAQSDISTELKVSSTFNDNQIANYVAKQNGLVETGLSFGIGGAAGYLGAMLLGPIGVALAIVSVSHGGQAVSDYRQRQSWASAKIRIVNEMKIQIDSILAECSMNVWSQTNSVHLN